MRNRRSSLYGDAALIKNSASGVKFIQCSKFWIPFRQFLPITAPIIAIITFLIPFATQSPSAGNFLLAGSLLSLLCTILTVISYAHILPWRKHPSFLLLQRVLSSLIFSIAIVTKELAPSRLAQDCLQYKAFLLQFSLLSGELWFFMLSLDLYVGLTDPFSSVQLSQSRYSAFVWSMAILISSLLVNGVGNCQGSFESRSGISLCWISDREPGRYGISTCLWMYFLGWVVFFYAASVISVFFAYQRLSRGLETTYLARKACVYDSFRMVFCHLCYGLLLSVLFVTISRNKHGFLDFVSNLFAFVVGCRGFFDSLVWFFLHDFKESRSRRPLCAALRSTKRACLRAVCGMQKREASFGSAWDVTHDRAAPLLQSSQPVPDRENRASRVSFAAMLDLESSDGESDEDIEESYSTGIGNRSSQSTGIRNLYASHTDNRDIDLSPQLNLALRKEVLHFVTSGIRESVNRWLNREEDFDQYSASFKVRAASCASSDAASLQSTNYPGSDSSGWGLRQRLDSAMLDAQAYKGLSMVGQSLRHIQGALGTAAALLGVPRGPGEYGEDPLIGSTHDLRGSLFGIGATPTRQESAASSSTPLWRHTMATALNTPTSLPPHTSNTAPPPPQEVVFDLDEKHRFRDWRPATFSVLRSLSGMSSERYLEIMSQPARERLREGGSGAFQFVCGQGEVIVKTIDKTEKATLLRILDGYVTHLQQHPNSLLVRFFGLHSLTMFGKEFSFVVMRNAFPPSVTINERYDLKGSWVGRNADALIPGSRQTCRHCGVFFLGGGMGGASACSVGVQGHEPDVVLKDNDLIHKIRLRSSDCYDVIESINNDSDALCSLGMMDYSLLIGVRNKKYDLDTEGSYSTRRSVSIVGRGSMGCSAAATAAAVIGASMEITSSDATGARLAQSSGSRHQSIDQNRDGAQDTRNDRMSVASTADTVVGLRVPYVAGSSQRYQIALKGGVAMQNSNEAYRDMYGGIDGDNDDGEMRTASIEELRNTRDSDFEDLGDPRVSLALHARAMQSDGYPARAVIAPSHYFVGIVDILQGWTWGKRLEWIVRVVFLGQNSAGISCTDPSFYKSRFQSKVSHVFDHTAFVREVTGGWSGNRVVSHTHTLEEEDGEGLG